MGRPKEFHHTQKQKSLHGNPLPTLEGCTHPLLYSSHDPPTSQQVVTAAVLCMALLSTRPTMSDKQPKLHYAFHVAKEKLVLQHIGSIQFTGTRCPM